MAGFTAAARETAAVAVATSTNSWVSLHTADPGITGASEATGGSPAYARKQTTWTAGAADGVSNGSQVIFNVPAGTYTHAGLWTAATGGTFIGAVSLTSPVLLAAQGEAKITPSVTVSS